MKLPGDLPTRCFRFLNPVLAALAVFAVALTLYCSANFYTWLPTADTWAYAHFLADAVQGRLDTVELLARHNGLHVIALPKLVYFLDMYLTRGTGAVVTLVSLVAMACTAAMFVAMVLRSDIAPREEKNFLALFSILVLVSACQVESLLNPANLQWSLLVFAATLAAWFLAAYSADREQQRNPWRNTGGVLIGVALAALTSASAFLIIIPIILVLVPKRWITGAIVSVPCVLLLALLVLVFRSSLPVSQVASLVGNWLVFTADFLVPPVERLHMPLATVIAALFMVAGLFRLYTSLSTATTKQYRFFLTLVYFSLVTILATGVVRSYEVSAFTFRFVNIGLLLAAALLPLLWMQQQHKPLLVIITCVYAIVLSGVNITEASAFAWGRNHIRLAQVAQALDINDSFVLASMPGSAWEKDEVAGIQTNKHFLQEVGAGIYSSDAFFHVNAPVTQLTGFSPVECKTDVAKIRRLLPEQAGWRIQGSTRAADGTAFSTAYFVDDENIIRGFAIPIQPGRNLLADLFVEKPWAGFVNLDRSSRQHVVDIYAYSDRQLCRAERITLPAYEELKTKNNRDGNPG